MTLALTWLLACARTEPTDMTLYLESVHAPVEEAFALCSAIEGDETRAECRAEVVTRAAAAGDLQTAATWCETIQLDGWKSECFFLAADAAGLVGDAAREWCARTGSFEDDCLGHALGRAVRAAELPRAVGEEEALQQALLPIVEAYDTKHTPEHRVHIARSYTARLVSMRWEDGTFDRSLCGALDEETCVHAYRMSVQTQVHEETLDALCDAGPVQRRVVAAGAPGWTEGAAPLARQAWTTLCRNSVLNRDREQAHALKPLVVPMRTDFEEMLAE